MNANVEQTPVLQEDFFGTAQCADELNQISDSLQRREELLVASARASRLLLEAPTCAAAMPDVLRLIGEAARVDRVNLMLPQAGPNGEPLWSVEYEWVAEGVPLGPAYLDNAANSDLRAVIRSPARAARAQRVPESRFSRRISLRPDWRESAPRPRPSCRFSSPANSSASLASTTRGNAARSIPAELSALETAAGVIGAALHRERLVDDVRRERERAAEERVAELAKANAVIRSNLERLASEPDLHAFMGTCCSRPPDSSMRPPAPSSCQSRHLKEWRILAHVRNGQLEPPPFAASMPFAGSPLTEFFGRSTKPAYYQSRNTPIGRSGRAISSSTVASSTSAC